MIPVSTYGGKARMSAARQFIVFALDDEFRLPKGIVIARMVHVEMGADKDIDIVRAQTQIGELLDHIFFVLCFRRSRRQRCIRGEPAIDQDMLPIAGFDEIANANHQALSSKIGYSAVYSWPLHSYIL